MLGEGADDILIGGYTAYDTDYAALDLIMAEWGRTDINFSSRVANLRAGVGPGGLIKLDATTVFDDNASDTLTGGPGSDWLFGRTTGSNADTFSQGEAFN